MSAVEWMMKCFPEVKELEDMRRAIGKFALTGKQQVSFLICVPLSTVSLLHRLRFDSVVKLHQC